MNYYQTTTGQSTSEPHETIINTWKHYAIKSNWRITLLLNGYYQTEIVTPDGEWVDVTRRKTTNEAEIAINSSIAYYNKKLEFLNGPKVIKTFD
jgi:hypothetical protein